MRIPVVALLFVLMPTSVLAWQARPAGAGAVPEATAVRVGDPVRIDGSLDEAVWAALFRAEPDNVLVFKVNYWLNP